MNAAVAPVLEPEVYRWKRSDFCRFLGSGVVEDPSRFELLDGLIFRHPMENPSHSVVCGLVHDALLPSCENRFHVRVQNPLAIEDESEPEPDLAVVTGSRKDYLKDHPRTAELVVEASDTTLHIDHGRKLRAYARNQIPEYWIVNLSKRQLEIYRAPSRERESYLEAEIPRAGTEVSPLFSPGSRIKVDALFP